MDLGRLAVLVRQLQGKAGVDGGVTITWPGGGSLSNAMTVPHGLKAAPSQVQATANTPEITASVTSVNATNIVIQCREVNGTAKGAGSFGFVRWWARI